MHSIRITSQWFKPFRTANQFRQLLCVYLLQVFFPLGTLFQLKRVGEVTQRNLTISSAWGRRELSKYLTHWFQSTNILILEARGDYSEHHFDDNNVFANHSTIIRCWKNLDQKANHRLWYINFETVSDLMFFSMYIIRNRIFIGKLLTALSPMHWLKALIFLAFGIRKLFDCSNWFLSTLQAIAYSCLHNPVRDGEVCFRNLNS